jgi:hypothetical protein
MRQVHTTTRPVEVTTTTATTMYRDDAVSTGSGGMFYLMYSYFFSTNKLLPFFNFRFY